MYNKKLPEAVFCYTSVMKKYIAFAGLLIVTLFVGVVSYAEAATCPKGYTCTPIPAQPTGCPSGYICSVYTGGVSTTDVATNFIAQISNVTSKASEDFEIAAGEPAAITGINLSNGKDTRVFVNGIEASITQIDNSLIWANMPKGLQLGGYYTLQLRTVAGAVKSNTVKVKVIRGSSTATPITGASYISSITSKGNEAFEVSPGQSIIIGGQNLTSPDGTRVFIDGTELQVTQLNSDMVYANVPSNVGTGQRTLYITSTGGTKRTSTTVYVRGGTVTKPVVTPATPAAPAQSTFATIKETTNLKINDSYMGQSYGPGQKIEIVWYWLTKKKPLSPTIIFYNEAGKAVYSRSLAFLSSSERQADTVSTSIFPQSGNYRFSICDSMPGVMSAECVSVGYFNVQLVASTSSTVTAVPRIEFTKLPEKQVLTVGDKLYWGWKTIDYPNYQASVTNNSVDYVDLYLVPTDGSPRILWGTNFWVHEPNQPQYINITENTIKRSAIVGKPFKIRIECQTRNVTSKTCVAESEGTYTIRSLAKDSTNTSFVWQAFKNLFGN